MFGRVQQTNLGYLDKLLKEQWNLGKNILLCWTLDSQGIKALVVPHYYLGQFSASLNDCAPVDRLDALNGRFIRELISGRRQLSGEDFRGAASRLELTPVPLRLPLPLPEEPSVLDAVDEMVKRYSINHVKSRAVLLFDIVDFSLVTPFEQTAQLNSLSYSLNSANNKLRQKNIAINFSRSTTGDGYYVWNHDVSPRGNIELFQFMLLVIADNALARRADRSPTVPQIRTGFHIGSHFEFYQVEGLDPGMNSYIVGDVTIELARMLDLAGSGQIFIGDFDTVVPTSAREGAYLIASDTQRFVERAGKQMLDLRGIELSGEQIEAIHCFLTGDAGASGGQSVRRFRITDKHGRSRNAYNLRINIRASHCTPLILGEQESGLPKRHYRRNGGIQINSQVNNSVSARRERRKVTIAALED